MKCASSSYKTHHSQSSHPHPTKGLVLTSTPWSWHLDLKTKTLMPDSRPTPRSWHLGVETKTSTLGLKTKTKTSTPDSRLTPGYWLLRQTPRPQHWVSWPGPRPWCQARPSASEVTTIWRYTNVYIIIIIIIRDQHQGLDTWVLRPRPQHWVSRPRPWHRIRDQQHDRAPRSIDQNQKLTINTFKRISK